MALQVRLGQQDIFLVVAVQERKPILADQHHQAVVVEQEVEQVQEPMEQPTQVVEVVELVKLVLQFQVVVDLV